MSRKRSTAKTKICPGCETEMPRSSFARHLTDCELGRQKMDARHHTYCACGRLAPKGYDCFRCSGGREDIDQFFMGRGLTPAQWRELHGERVHSA